MKKTNKYCVLTFDKTIDAIAAEKICLENNIPGRLIPLPVKISAGCGLAWRMGEDDYKSYESLISSLDIKYDSVVYLEMK
jgi:hypothetical protein